MVGKDTRSLVMTVDGSILPGLKIVGVAQAGQWSELERRWSAAFDIIDARADAVEDEDDLAVVLYMTEPAGEC